MNPEYWYTGLIGEKTIYLFLEKKKIVKNKALNALKTNVFISV